MLKIKPLVWEERGESLYYLVQAETAFGLVRVEAYGREIEWASPRYDRTLRTEFRSEKEAKAYVQEQHEARIRSFIEGDTDE